jgi:DNA-binding CsgD family transcriptional regulator
MSHPELTRRQCEVLSLVARGMTNARIGRELGITEESVKRHVRALRLVLGAADRAAAVNEGWRHGYLPWRGEIRVYRMICDGDCDHGVHACPSRASRVARRSA